MKLRLFLSVILLALVASPMVRAADTGLEKEMKDIKNAFNQLRKQVADPAQNTASLALVAKMRAAAKSSLSLEPEKTADLPAKDRTAFVADYKDEMKTFIANLDKLAAALKAGNNADAIKIVADLKTMQREAHKEFRKSDD